MRLLALLLLCFFSSAHAAEPRRDESLHSLGIKLRDQEGQAIGLDHFSGRPVIIALFYARCPSACPVLISDIKRIEAALSPEARSSMGVLLVSFDAERDGPESFGKVVKLHGLDSKRWRLTTASAADVRTLAAVLGVRYSNLPDGGYAHSSVITVLTPSGEIDTKLEGALQPVDELVKHIERLSHP